jgi:hypothetical protein
LVGGILVSAMPLGAWALVAAMIRFAEDSLSSSMVEQLIASVMTVGMPLLALAGVIALALSIFYRGMIDPRLAARKVTVWGLLGIIVTVAFVFFERAPGDQDHAMAGDAGGVGAGRGGCPGGRYRHTASRRSRARCEQPRHALPSR